MKHVEKQARTGIALEDVPEFAFLGINIELNFGALDTLRVSDPVDVFNVASSGKSGR